METLARVAISRLVKNEVEEAVTTNEVAVATTNVAEAVPDAEEAEAADRIAVATN